MEEKLNDQMLIRRGKLEKIAALGFEPYGGKYECTHHSEDIHANAAALEASGGACQSGRPYYDHPRAWKNGILHTS